MASTKANDQQTHTPATGESSVYDNLQGKTDVIKRRCVWVPVINRWVVHKEENASGWFWRSSDLSTQSTGIYHPVGQNGFQTAAWLRQH